MDGPLELSLDPLIRLTITSTSEDGELMWGKETVGSRVFKTN